MKDRRPEWINLREVTHYFGIGETMCRELINSGVIYSRLKKIYPDKEIRMRMVLFDSMDEYFQTL